MQFLTFLKRKVLLVSAFVCSAFCLFAQKQEVWMTYNVQNLFDGTYSGTEYQSFSQKRWNDYYASLKIKQLAQVFTDIHEQQGDFGLVLLQEVENISIAEQLRLHTPSLYPLKIVFAKKDGQTNGIVLMTHYAIKKVEHLDSSLFGAQSRPILLTTLSVKDQDVLVINVHLPSQLRSKNYEKRVKALSLISEQVKKAIYGGTTVFLAGDFNHDLMCLPCDQFPYLNEPTFNIEEMTYLVNGYALVQQPSVAGTYCYRGFWQRLDYIFFSYQFFNPSGQGLSVKEVIIFAPDYMRMDATSGGAPRPFKKGDKSPDGSMGYSDHFPLLAIIYV